MDRDAFLPQEYKLPRKSSPLVVWQQWCCGVKSQKIRPLRHVTGRDLFDKGEQKVFSDVKYHCQEIEKLVKAKDKWIESPTLKEATMMFESVEVDFVAACGVERNKRNAQLSWVTFASSMRKSRKRGRVAASGAAGVAVASGSVDGDGNSAAVDDVGDVVGASDATPADADCAED